MMLFNIGCSLSSEIRLQSGPDRTFHKPYGPHIAEHLNLSYLNFSMSGYSNELIYSIFMNEIAKRKKKISVVVVQWSEWDRITLHPTAERKPFTCAPGRFIGEYNRYFTNKLSDIRTEQKKVVFEKFKTKEHNYLIQYLKIYLYHIEDVKQLINEQMMRMFSVQEVCNSLGIKLIQFQAPNIFNSHKERPLTDVDRDKIRQTIFDHPIFRTIDEKKFWGWPIYENYGGIDYLHWLDNIGYNHETEENKFHIWPNYDMHPNREGHELFSKELINFYEKMYL